MKLEKCLAHLATIVPMLITLAANAWPDKYDSEPSRFKGFLSQCSQYFASHAEITDQQKVAEFIVLITGKVLQWAIGVWDSGDVDLACFNCVLVLSRKVSEHCPEGGEVRETCAVLSFF